MLNCLFVALVFLVLTAGTSSAFAAQETKVDLPDAIGELAEPINDSRASINAFSCAEIVKSWKSDDDVTRYLRIGRSRGLRLLEWMEKSPKDKLDKVGMNLAGFWKANLEGKALDNDFYLGRVSSHVSSFLKESYLEVKLPQSPPQNVTGYLKSAEAKVGKMREKLFSDYQCSKLK